MLLAIDMGNTQTAMGLFDGDELVQSWRMPTDRSYTADEIHVGAVTGAAAMAEGLVARMKRELGREDATVIATGGLASIVADSTDAFDIVDGQLTIKGICEIYRRMQELG